MFGRDQLQWLSKLERIVIIANVLNYLFCRKGQKSMDFGFFSCRNHCNESCRFYNCSFREVRQLALHLLRDNPNWGARQLLEAWSPSGWADLMKTSALECRAGLPEPRLKLVSEQEFRLLELSSTTLQGDMSWLAAMPICSFCAGNE